MKDATVDMIRCPACEADPGASCVTLVGGIDTHWTHDARVYEAIGARA